MKKDRHPFTLPNGMTVLVRPYTTDDYDTLNRWVKKKYMENVREACYGLEEATKLELRLAALNNAAKLSFLYGDGNDILMGDVHGFAYMGYLLIDNPTVSFDEYFHIIYPEGVFGKEGLENIVQMMGCAYGTSKNQTDSADTASKKDVGSDHNGSQAN